MTANGNTALARVETPPTELVTTGGTHTFGEIMGIAKVFTESGLFPDIKSVAAAAVKIMAGQELGFGPFASMSGIHIIKGKAEPGANMLANLVKKSGKYDYKVQRIDNQACEIVFYEGGQKVGVSTFTLDDAKKAQTQNLDKFPRNMLFARAMSNGIKWFSPDVENGIAVYAPGEIDSPVIEVAPELPRKDDRRQVPPPEAHSVAESAQIRARFEATLDARKHTKPEVLAIAADFAKVCAQLTTEDINAFRDKVKAKLEGANGKPPTPEMAPLDLVSELHALITGNRSRYKTWRATLAASGVDLPQAFEEPETDDDLTHVCDWLPKADALRVRDGFRQAAKNVRQHNGRGPEDDPPDPTDEQMAALDAATAG